MMKRCTRKYSKAAEEKAQRHSRLEDFLEPLHLLLGREPVRQKQRRYRRTQKASQHTDRPSCNVPEVSRLQSRMSSGSAKKAQEWKTCKRVDLISVIHMVKGRVRLHRKIEGEMHGVRPAVPAFQRVYPYVPHPATAHLHRQQRLEAAPQQI